MSSAQYLERRASGIYFDRLYVPARLKAAVGKGVVRDNDGDYQKHCVENYIGLLGAKARTHAIAPASVATKRLNPVGARQRIARTSGQS